MSIVPLEGRDAADWAEDEGDGGDQMEVSAVRDMQKLQLSYYNLK
jgi:hypothetical protein